MSFEEAYCSAHNIKGILHIHWDFAEPLESTHAGKHPTWCKQVGLGLGALHLHVSAIFFVLYVVPIHELL
jgi:hypothetical protein